MWSTPAVKATLKSLLEAQVVTSNVGRSRGGRRRAAATGDDGRSR
jgi:hypothetical protein